MLSGRSRLSNHSFRHERPLHEKAGVGRKPSNDGSADKPAVRCGAEPDSQLNGCSADKTAICILGTSHAGSRDLCQRKPRCSVMETGDTMAANNATELIKLFSERFSDGDIDGLMQLYENDAVFPNHHTTAKGAEQIRPVLQGYIDSGARLEFNRQVAFETGDIAMVQNAWILTTANGDEVTGVTVEFARK
jgi:ketosteroid isomerase-like protein